MNRRFLVKAQAFGGPNGDLRTLAWNRFGAAWLFWGAFGFAAELKPAEPLSKPNIVIIVADDLGYGDLGCYGAKAVQTPNIDGLASSGLRFTDFHSSGCNCSPTRAGMLTGRYQQRCGVDEVINPRMKGPNYGLQSTEVTLPRTLRDAGYATGLIGKWHVGFSPDNHPFKQGFEVFHGLIGGANDYYTHQNREGQPDWWDGLTQVQEEGYATRLITQHAVEFIQHNQNHPFFLCVTHQAVHGPLNDPKENPGPKGSSASRKKSAANPREIYRAMTEELDKGVGTLMTTLKELKLESNTIVFFFSDNGALAVGSNGVLRGAKHTLWEGGHREPAIVWWPNKIKPGVNSDLVTSLDLMPTIDRIAGVTLPPSHKLDGTDLSPLLFGKGNLEARPIFWSHRGDFAMRDGPWKLLQENGITHLYNLSEDLAETKDLAQLEPQRVALMSERTNAWFKEVSRNDAVRRSLRAKKARAIPAEE